MKIKDIDIVKIHVDMPKESNDIILTDMMLQKGITNIGQMFHRITCRANIQYRTLGDALTAYFVSSVLASSTNRLPPILDEQGVHTEGTVSFIITLSDIIGFLSNALPPRLKPMLQQIKSVKEYIDILNTMLSDDSNSSTQMYNWDMFTKAFGLRIEVIGTDMSKPHPLKMRLKMLYDRYPAFKKELGNFSCFIPSASISIQDIIDKTEYSKEHKALYAFYAESLDGLTDIYHMNDNILHLEPCDFYYDGTCYIVCAIDSDATVNDDFVRRLYKDILKI